MDSPNTSTPASKPGASAGPDCAEATGSASSVRRSEADRKDFLRARIRARDGDHCHWCGVELRFAGKRTSRVFATIDHLRRKSKGGWRTLGNCVLACGPCNHGRHHAGWTPTDWSKNPQLVVKKKAPQNYKLSNAGQSTNE